MKTMWKPIVTGSLALSMLLGSSAAALAKDNGHGHGKDFEGMNNKGRNEAPIKANGNATVNLRLSFEDLKGGDVEWAARYIASLASKRVFEGYEDGSFKPRNAISRIEAITAAVRLMGLRDQAESSAEMATQLNFKDANKIPSWAVGYVAVALENDLFSESDDAVQPQKDADRLWATTLLVKALKLESEAKAKMNTKLSFRDADKIPAGSVGYVAVAIDKGLIDGFEDNTFRPNQAVTRAQLAALLDRTGDQMPDKDTSSGTVSAAVYGNALTLVKAGVTTQLVLNPNAFIFRDGVQVPATALQVGDVVKARSYNGQVIFVEVVKKGQSVDPAFSATGFLAATTMNASGKIATISLTQTVNGAVQTTVYNVSPTVAITGDLSQFVTNHLIEVRGTSQLVTSIDIK
ncbi:S-layer homology domain-containing protein [Paenibacillus athensensis]|uniref:S-layer protein n=1 Tax=Paenibacillus athensensis TaxID=1967502 RepID=A0A4Y8Q764_9BACL|nr:S-layer homology domain-containing protein [Paenibacillus athensensis]MCD1259708.1 S-layer homology domain-containing protein [Paenibacillus athensensis]